MLLDLNDQILQSFAPTATGANVYQFYIDRLLAMEDGAGEPIYVYGQVAAAVTSGGAATVDFQLIGNPSDPTFAAGNVIIRDTGVLPKATLIKGYQFFREVIPRQPDSSLETTGLFLRYITIGVAIGTAVLTAGTFNAWATYKLLQDNISYPRNFNV
jgi:hypothetical protein